MKVYTDLQHPEIISALQCGDIGIVRTDTLYGVIARADDQQAVARVYSIKERSEHKSPIVLISTIDQLYDPIPQHAKQIIGDSWPGAVSIILPSTQAPVWIRRGNNSVAYRLPDHAELQKLISVTGPLVAPSANFEGAQPAMSVTEAQNIFGENVDFYVDGGIVSDGTPSKLISVSLDGQVERLR